MIIVSDNSALSCLAELGELDLLQKLYGTVVITDTIRQEACHPRAPETLRLFIAEAPSWLVVLADVTPYLEETHALDPGEASAITLAWENRESCLLIIDEKRGRRVSSALGLKITGVAGVLTDAAAAGLVDFEEAFQRLAQTQFRLSVTVVEELRLRYQTHPHPPEDPPMERRVHD